MPNGPIQEALDMLPKLIKEGKFLPRIAGTGLLKQKPLSDWLRGCKMLSALLNGIYQRENPWATDLQAEQLRTTRNSPLRDELVIVLQGIYETMKSEYPQN